MVTLLNSAPLQTGVTENSPIQALISLLKVPAAAIDSSGMIRHLNVSWAGLSSIPASTLNQLFHPADRQNLAEQLQALPQGDDVQNFEARMSCGRWVIVSLQAIDTEEAPLWLVTTTDIDAHKTAGQTLQKYNRIHTQLLNTSEDCIKLLDPSGSLIYMNKAGCEALSIEPENVAGTRWIKLLPPEVLPLAEEALEQVLSGETARFIGRSALPNGEIIIWENVLTPYREEDGEVTTILCISRNNSQAHRIETQLRESQERLEMATKVGQLGIWDLNIKTGRLYCDETWHQIMGLGAGQVIDNIDDFHAMIHPEDRSNHAEISSAANTLVKDGQNYARHYRVIRPDGSIITIRTAAYIVADIAGHAVRAVGFVTDITNNADTSS